MSCYKLVDKPFFLKRYSPRPSTMQADMLIQQMIDFSESYKFQYLWTCVFSLGFLTEFLIAFITSRYKKGVIEK